VAYINLPPSLQGFFNRIEARLLKLETANRFTAPVVPALGSTPTITGLASGDPQNPRVGDIWLNTTSNTPKYVNATGAVTTLGGGGGSSTIVPPRVKTGYYYSNLGADNSGNFSVNSPATVLFMQPFYLGSAATAVRLAVQVQGTAAGGVMRLGIYNNAATTDYPDTLLLDAGTVSTATIGAKQITISQSLTAGLYWLAYLSTTGSPQISGVDSISNSGVVTGANPNTTMIPGFSLSPFTGVTNIGWQQTGVGSFPATFTGTTLIGSVGTVWIGF
jgi:hypothetical protein